SKLLCCIENEVWRSQERTYCGAVSDRKVTAPTVVVPNGLVIGEERGFSSTVTSSVGSMNEISVGRIASCGIIGDVPMKRPSDKLFKLAVRKQCRPRRVR